MEWRRCREEEDEKKKIEEAKRQREQIEAAEEIVAPHMVEKLVYINPAAAGTPLYAESDNEDGTIRLESDNPGFGPVEISEFDELIPVGEVIGVVMMK